MLAITSDRIRFVIKMLLSGITGFWLYKEFNPSVRLIDFNDYSIPMIEQFLSSGTFTWSVISLFASWLFFYVLGKILLMNIIHAPLEKYYGKKISKLSPTEKRQMYAFFIKKLIRPVIRWIRKKHLLSFHKMNVRDIPETEIVHFPPDMYYSFILMGTHVIVCLFILGVPLNFIVCALMFVIVILFLILL